MGTTNIIGFANATGADVQSDDTYKAGAPTGFVPGPAYPNQANKALRQSSSVAAAIAKLVTDPSMGDQATFNDAEDASALATKLLQAINNLQPTKLNNIVVDLLKRMLSNSNINPGEWTKFSDASLLGYTDAQRDAVVLDSLYKTLLTRTGILARPPVSDWLYLLNAPEASTYTGLPGYVRERQFRVLANGMVEVRIGFNRGFVPRTPAFVVGYLPNRLAPTSTEVKGIIGSVASTNKTPTLSTADAQVEVKPVPIARIETIPDMAHVQVSVGLPPLLFELARDVTWRMESGDVDNPWGLPGNAPDPNALSGTIVSLCYMPRFPYPYPYYKLNPNP